jgi:hypothetical protein
LTCSLVGGRASSGLPLQRSLSAACARGVNYARTTSLENFLNARVNRRYPPPAFTAPLIRKQKFSLSLCLTFCTLTVPALGRTLKK